MWSKIAHDMSSQTLAFIIVIFMFTVYFHARSTPDNRQKAPAFLTTLGILGTFVGIAFGLLEFNASDVQKSVPSLIDGIKTAVWASAWGILCALSIKLRDILAGRKKTSKQVSGATIDDLATGLVTLEQALVAEEDSVLSELKLARKENAEAMATLNNALEKFYEKIAEASSQALVKALNEVIRDFNVKLNEQFGDNFKKLNEASEKLLTWQTHYSQQIDQMITQQTATTKNMQLAAERYTQMVTNAEIFNTIATNMSSLLVGLQTQRTQLDESLRSLAMLISSASSGLPQIEKQILEMTRQVNEGVRMTNDELNASIKNLIEQTKEQVLILDKALSEELTKSLESFGRQMAALSGKFAADYGPITEKLQQVLKIAG